VERLVAIGEMVEKLLRTLCDWFV